MRYRSYEAFSRRHDPEPPVPPVHGPITFAQALLELLEAAWDAGYSAGGCSWDDDYYDDDEPTSFRGFLEVSWLSEWLDIDPKEEACCR